MKVTIEGSLEQITELVDAPAAVNKKASRGQSEIAKRNSEIQRRRQIVHQAFKLVRNDPTQTVMRDYLLEALQGDPPIAQDVVQEAGRVIADQQKAQG